MTFDEWFEQEVNRVSSYEWYSWHLCKNKLEQAYNAGIRHSNKNINVEHDSPSEERNDDAN